jgi:hypothetical protein
MLIAPDRRVSGPGSDGEYMMQDDATFSQWLLERTKSVELFRDNPELFGQLSA